MEIQNKVAIVLGGFGGIGFASVQHLIRNKIQFVAILDFPDFNSEIAVKNLQKLQEEFREEKYRYYSCDIKNTQQFRDIFNQVFASKKCVDILVNAAGILNDNVLDLCIDLNLKTVLNSTMIAIEYMRTDKGGKGGVVVNVASIAGINNKPTHPIYIASKHGVVAFTRSMKTHNQTIGVRVVCICPGFTQTSMTDENNMRNSLLDFIDWKILENHTSVKICQSPDHVALAITEIISKGEDGAVWVVENGEAPYAV